MLDYRKEYELEETINGIIIAKSKSYQEVRDDRPEVEKDYGTFKYYGLFCWGGFFNKQFHDYRTNENGEFIKYFTSPQDRQEYLEKMQSVEREHNCARLVNSFFQSNYKNNRLFAKVTVDFQDKEYTFEYDFGVSTEENTAIYIFEEGNYSCDCNLIRFLDRNFDMGMTEDQVQEYKCGETIKLVNLELYWKVVE